MILTKTGLYLFVHARQEARDRYITQLDSNTQCYSIATKTASSIGDGFFKAKV